MRQLLPGEAPASRDPAHARRWVAAYSELVALDQRLLEGAGGAGGAAGPIATHLEWCRARLGFWRERRLDLADR